MTSAGSGNEGSNILMSERYFNPLESDSDIRIRRMNEQYLDIFETICKYALIRPDKEILLSGLLLAAKDEYEKLVPDLKVLTSVLLQLGNMKNIDFTVIKEQKAKTVFNPSEELDIKYCVLALLDRSEDYRSISGMKVSVSRNKQVFIPERITVTEPEGGGSDSYTASEPVGDDNGSFTAASVMGLRCPDILFRIEVEGFE